MEQSQPQKQNKAKAVTTITTASPFDLQLKVSVLKTYQPVDFKKKLETHFTAKRQGFEGIEITFYPSLQIITIKQPGKDSKVVVPSNVEYMEIEGI